MLVILLGLEFPLISFSTELDDDVVDGNIEDGADNDGAVEVVTEGLVAVVVGAKALSPEFPTPTALATAAPAAAVLAALLAEFLLTTLVA